MCLDRGQHLELFDVEGGQAIDVVAFAADDPDDWMCSGRSFDYNGRILLTTGHTPWSQRSWPMFEINADSVGRHDLLLAPCSHEMFEIQYDAKERGPNCVDNLVSALAPYNV